MYKAFLCIYVKSPFSISDSWIVLCLDMKTFLLCVICAYVFVINAYLSQGDTYVNVVEKAADLFNN